MKLKQWGLFALLSSLTACSGTDRASSRGARTTVVDSSGGTVALGLSSTRTYRPAATTASGAIAGTVSLQGTRRDSMVAVGRDADVCGDSIAVTQTDAVGNSMANVLVWVDGIASG